MFQVALQRALAPENATDPVVIGHADYRFLMAKQANAVDIPLSGLILEPIARNTAPAVAIAAVWAIRSNPEALVHILTADHAIEANADYLQAVEVACRAAEDGSIATFGIEPEFPSTGYGYVEVGAALAEGASRAKCFIEKPHLDKAVEMLAAGSFYWNSGMFLFSAKAMVEAFHVHHPDILAVAEQALDKAETDFDFIHLPEAVFSKAESISIDYAIAEKVDTMAVVPSRFPWSDIGAWDAVRDVNPKDEHGNVARGPATFVNASNSLVVSNDVHVAINGLDNVAVISTDDAILVSSLQNAQTVKAVVSELQKSQDTTHLLLDHTTTHQPWGGCCLIASGDRYQVKRLLVEPGKQLSPRKNHHRVEHWIVVQGSAEITVEGETRLLRENESICIPHGAMYRLVNTGKIRLELIEVQFRSCLGEDDIVRPRDDQNHT